MNYYNIVVMHEKNIHNTHHTRNIFEFQLHRTVGGMMVTRDEKEAFKLVGKCERALEDYKLTYNVKMETLVIVVKRSNNDSSTRTLEFISLLEHNNIRYHILNDGTVVVRGRVDLSYEAVTMPVKLIVDGSLTLEECEIKSMPSELIVRDKLSLSRSKFTNLPSILHVGEELRVYNARIDIFPDDLYVGGSMLLFRTKLKALPNNLIIPEHLDIRETGAAIPNNLYAGGTLDTSDSVERLPSDTKVGKWQTDRKSYARF